MSTEHPWPEDAPEAEAGPEIDPELTARISDLVRAAVDGDESAAEALADVR